MSSQSTFSHQADVPYKVIASSEDGEVNVTLAPLPTVEEEVIEVEKLLSNFKKIGAPIGKVRVIKRETIPAGDSFKDEVERVLNKGAWQVLHYAGHTYLQDQVGYLFFPSGDDKLEPIKIDYFAYFLRKSDTRFVFLSSCEGGQQDFIYHLSKQGVPAIMGFLWNVNDPKATDYAKSFYKHLFGEKERSLEYACMEAKKEMAAKFRENPIWASAVLVMRVGV
jgi:CHAT domain-containing protein